MKGSDILRVHAEQHPLVIDLDQHHFVFEPHWINF